MVDSSPEDEDFPGRLLHQAALWDNTTLLEDLIEGGQQHFLDSQDSWGRTPLHAAAITENSLCLQILLQKGANANIQCGPSGESKTPLHLSAEHGHTSNVSILLNYDANIFIRDMNGMTPSDLADKLGHAKCVALLKDYADMKERTRQDLHGALRNACINREFTVVKAILSKLSKDTENIVNMAPGGANTLLFLTCQNGNKDIARLLLEYGADGRYHPVTKYSPLYIACYHGHKEIVEMLLLRFPELVQQHTVERWLPIHACCINGHVSLLAFLFNFEYPSHILNTYTDSSGNWEFSLPFNLNEQDASGQNILYIACLVGNKQLLDVILNFKIKSFHKQPCKEGNSVSEKNAAPQYTQRRVSSGIQSIMHKLNISNPKYEIEPNITLICPLKIDMYCNNNTETALHASVKGQHYDIVLDLLKAGANPNTPMRIYHDMTEIESCVPVSENSFYEQSTVLVEACRNRDSSMLELLLLYGARDDNCKALTIAVLNKDESLIAKLLSVKAHPDHEHKINKKAMNEHFSSSQFSIFPNITHVTYGSIFPSTPVMINWHNQYSNLSHIKEQWLVDAVLHLNQKLRQHPRSKDISLYAITRLDISNNLLTYIPSVVFQLSSLKYLNIAQNKITKLPEPERRSKKRIGQNDYLNYTCPILEELYLQDNRLDQIPGAVFRLPNLITVVVSNNKLQHLPYDIWLAPKLKELNVSFNLLKELPINPTEWSSEESGGSMTSSDSGYQLTAYTAQQNEVAKLPNSPSISRSLNVESFTPTILYGKSLGRASNPVKLNKHHIWNKNVEVSEQVMFNDDSTTQESSQLSALNLAHNLFTSVPEVLPCLAINLTRLNMAFNSLRSMSHITNYPSSLKQLDLSHNQITCWPSLPQVETQDSTEAGSVTCYNTSSSNTDKIPGIPVRKGNSVRTAVVHSVCVHRRHLRLDNLRTLILADNHLTRIQLTTDDDGSVSNAEDDESEFYKMNKARLMFPNLSMLDVSNNDLKEISSNIHELSNLSVLNISGNMEIKELPPQMGLLSRLWNLNTRGCSLHEPLKSMIDSKMYKTMDIVGYLKSVLEDARPYARIKLMLVGIHHIGKTSLLEQLRQEGTVSKRPEHWTKRMGNKNPNVKASKISNMSTVGVDIGDWMYEKKGRNQSTHGPVTFRTWDFGGQKEYYATHQYFLSKRSLYLVVWKITDGYKGIDEILQWLVNIQARAPNSPVIIVGTHYDVVQELDPFISETYQQIIRDRFINIVDAEKCGLPRVLDTIETSCKTRHNIRLLCNLIYDMAFSLRSPGSKQLLLEQKVPATYLRLEEVINHIAIERKMSGLDPVVNSDQYKAIVSTEMMQKFNKTFRDSAELHQATLFLHDNGVLLHYDDATLKDLYFLDPQWLCDILAHVVTVREINPFGQYGVMKLEDLKHIIKSSNVGPIDMKCYIVNLLNKFEVALSWDSRTLLIPSLLPSEEDTMKAQKYPRQFNTLVKVKLPVTSRAWVLRNKKMSLQGKSILYQKSQSQDNFQMVLPSKSQKVRENETQHAMLNCIIIPSVANIPITRLLLMSYFPSGFWSRLISRILADDAISGIVNTMFATVEQVPQDIEWTLWQTGMELKYGDTTLFRISELLLNSPYKQMRLQMKQEGIWCDADLQNNSILEIHFPLTSFDLKSSFDENEINLSSEKIEMSSSVSIKATAQLLALIVDHVDVLLEDWYPTLGTRFIHTSEGKFLITRLIPCPQCLLQFNEEQNLACSPNDMNQPRQLLEVIHQSHRRFMGAENIKQRKSQESHTSECDSGVEPDSTGSSRLASMEGHPELSMEEECSNSPIYYSWMVEECILAAYGSKMVTCPLHTDIALSRIAPDTIFMDLEESYLIKPQNIKIGKLLGRGAFGFVFKGSYNVQPTGSNVIEVAMKMLQPTKPEPNARQSAIIAYNAVRSKWDRDPLQYSCKAYCTARQELNILLSLRHPNIIPLIGICTNPLALVLDLAPAGALDLVLKHYRRCGAKLTPYTLQIVILQVAKAIEYLHRQHIIYRDLKSENVLVWEMPQPFVYSVLSPVHIKLADYGISRSTLPSGTKGFGGTEGFMAPEIMRYNGEEEYTEKVDCFSFGMFIYELLTLHQPFEGHDSIKESILEGGRPSLTYKETLYPSYILDLMVLCWSQQHENRPSASQIVSVASAPEFTHLYDVISLKQEDYVVSSTSVDLSNTPDDGENGSEIWLMCGNFKIDVLLVVNRRWIQHHTINLTTSPTASCTVNNTIWIGDSTGTIHCYMAKDGCKLFSYNVDNEQIESLLHLTSMKRAVVALSNGKLYILNTEVSLPTATELFVVIQLKSDLAINSICCVVKDNGRSYEIWCSASTGKISIHTVENDRFVSHTTISYDQPFLEDIESIQLVSAEDSVMSYFLPGCIVYRWDTKSRTIVDKLDCSKLVPCSESLKSIAIEEHLSPTKCQVSSLAILNEEVYIGTTWGCIIVAERSSLRPITIFRPYEEEVRAVIPLRVCQSNESNRIPLIASVGRGYRNLLSRYTDVNLETNYAAEMHNVFMLLWGAEHWNIT